MYVKCYNHSSGTYLFEPFKNEKRPITFGSAVISGRIFYVNAMNNTSHNVYINRNSNIGVLHPVDGVQSNKLNMTVDANEIVVSKHSAEVPMLNRKDFPGNSDEYAAMMDLFRKHSDVFAKSDMDLGCTNAIKHRIKTVDDVPVNLPYRRIPPSQLEEVKQHIEKLIQKGAVVESTSDYASPIVVVRKRSGDIRLCNDFRLLNAKTVKDAHALPRINESMDALHGSKWFSCLDLQSAYAQVPMHPDEQHKTAFSTPFGLYEHTRMAYGLCNGPSTFQRLVQTMFRKELFNTILRYLDDVLVFSTTIQEHIERLDVVFTKLTEYGLKLEKLKCHFFQPEVKYLGHQVSASGIGTDPEKISAVREWPIPTKLRELRSFIGFTSYYRRYVAGYSTIAKPLHDLVTECCAETKYNKRTKFDIRDKWTDECRDAFNKLKEKLTEAPVLGFADYSKTFILETDASDRGLGAVLSQVQDEKNRVICYASRGLSKSEKNKANYSSRKLELLALKWAVVDQFSDYLIGGKNIVYTDNNPLTYLNKQKKLPAIEQRWANALAPFDLDIRYRSAKHNDNADALSRLQHQELVESDVDSCVEPTMLPITLRKTAMNSIPNGECNRVQMDDAITDVHRDSEMQNNVRIAETREATATLPTYTNKKWRQLQREDDILKRVIYYRDQGRIPTAAERKEERRDVVRLLCERVIIERNGLLYHKLDDSDNYQLLLPYSQRARVLENLHDDVGHQGIPRTEALVRERCYWLGIHNYVKDWINNCERCVKSKMPHVPVRTPLGHLTATRPLQIVAMDYTVLEPSSDGRENVLVLTDVFTKYTIAVATRNQRAETVARVLVNEWFFVFGVPLRLHSDMGRNFESQVIQSLCELYGIKKSHTTAAHPIGNGQVERFNRTLHNLLKSLAPEKKRRWADHLKELVHAYNITPHSSTGYSPHYLMFGRDCRLPSDRMFDRESSDVSEIGWVPAHRQRLDEAYARAERNMERTADQRKRTYDKRAKDAPLIIGERVYTRNRPLGRNKIQDAWDSTVYRVIQKQGNNNVYVIEPADGLGRQRTINRVDLGKCVHGNPMVDEISTYDEHKRHGLSRDKRHSSNNAATSSCSSSDEDQNINCARYNMRRRDKHLTYCA